MGSATLKDHLFLFVCLIMNNTILLYRVHIICVTTEDLNNDVIRGKHRYLWGFSPIKEMNPITRKRMTMNTAKEKSKPNTRARK